jgi:hypothetical protein
MVTITGTTAMASAMAAASATLLSPLLLGLAEPVAADLTTPRPAGLFGTGVFHRSSCASINGRDQRGSCRAGWCA